MESRIARELKVRYQPVAIIFTDEKPEDALQFKEGSRGCVVAMLSAVGRGETAVFDRRTYGCGGGGVGLGFGNTFSGAPGGIEYFLSTGRGEGYPEGEGYRKTPELARAFLDKLPITDIPFDYVVFKPLEQVEPDKETPQMVTFYVNADQLTALVVLANYDQPSSDNVIIPSAAGCQSVCLIPYHETQQEHPRAVVGMMDISARPHVDPDILSFTVPYQMFLRMEANVPGSFFEKGAWRKVSARIPDHPPENV